jgi:hypothetical protein
MKMSDFTHGLLSSPKGWRWHPKCNSSIMHLSFSVRFVLRTICPHTALERFSKCQGRAGVSPLTPLLKRQPSTCDNRLPADAGFGACTHSLSSHGTGLQGNSFRVHPVSQSYVKHCPVSSLLKTRRVFKPSILTNSVAVGTIKDVSNFQKIEHIAGSIY